VELYFLDWIPENKFLIALTSIMVNVFISLSGVLPSAFLTAANIAIFDLKMGLVVSIIGEAAGAVVSFILYRKGLTKISVQGKWKNKLLVKLQHTKGLEAVFLVLILRILPIIPSGVVTLFAAYSKMGIYSYSIASTIGKVPSLFIEAYAVKSAFELSTESQLGLSIFLILLLIIYYIFKKRNRKTSDI
jgi:uncharacterized membrane protein YdjX (TVP38/TMEM64 family)